MKYTLIAILVAVLMIGGTVLYIRADSTDIGTEQGQNVYEENGKQIIEITAKGGYTPKENEVKAGIASILRVNTKGTFDCSSALVIPSLGYRTNLKPSGVTDIEIPSQKSGTELQGICAMGMYSFQIKFF